MIITCGLLVLVLHLDNLTCMRLLFCKRFPRRQFGFFSFSLSFFLPINDPKESFVFFFGLPFFFFCLSNILSFSKWWRRLILMLLTRVVLFRICTAKSLWVRTNEYSHLFRPFQIRVLWRTIILLAVLRYTLALLSKKSAIAPYFLLCVGITLL